MSRQDARAALLTQSRAAHQRTFASNNGDHPDWPAWYAEYFAQPLGAALGRSLDRATLAAELECLDGEHRSSGGKEPWRITTRAGLSSTTAADR